MPKRVALTVGKFIPLHEGHRLMIQAAAENFDEVVVIISSRDEQYPDQPTLQERFDVLRDMYRYDDTVTIKMVLDLVGDPKRVDQNGTALDEDFLAHWDMIFKETAPNATHFVSSDVYGKMCAERLGIEWFPVDPKRLAVNISATEIRSDPDIHWDMIVPEFQKFYRKKIAIVGPESSGKSTLTEQLAQMYYGTMAPEWGRTISEQKPNLDEDDFVRIYNMQKLLSDTAEQNSKNGYSFHDTEALTTYLFSEIYLDRPMNRLEAMFRGQDFDLYILLKPDMPWVDDGSRILSDEKSRVDFYDKLRHCLAARGKPFVEIGGDKRLADSINAIDIHFEGR